MPTISPKLQDRSDLPGYSEDLSLTDEQIARIANLLDLEPADIRQPLSWAVAAIGMFAYIDATTPSPSQQRAALGKAIRPGNEFLETVQSFTPAASGLLRKVYAKGRRGLAADQAALRRLNADIEALRRLQGNLEIAQDLKVPIRRPRDELAVVIEEKLAEAYKQIFKGRELAPPRKEEMRRKRFLGVVKLMIEERRKEWEGAIFGN